MLCLIAESFNKEVIKIRNAITFFSSCSAFRISFSSSGLIFVRPRITKEVSNFSIKIFLEMYGEFIAEIKWINKNDFFAFFTIRDATLRG